ncbi:uncharacterized protein LOC106643405 [Copidosoma floridanum]|uniref:uncharacterized protein LOC106643405 n=1 Tax=Copidosoma floridanum TaxID=29053 RepID=UPI000C6F74CD|nr:uncharacterized protein LOC106643405 [Copidosoma floridanum]
MATKMYVLLEADKCQTDPVSRLVAQLVDQLKLQSSQNCESSRAVSIPNESKEHCQLKKPIEIVFPANGKRVKTAITAETCIDSCGQAKAKVSVSTNQDPGSDQALLPYCELVTEGYSCKRRNGLDPTNSELRGVKKFEYVPLKSKIPDYRDGCKGRSEAVADHPSRNDGGRKLDSRSMPVIAGLRQDCAKNLPRDRLVKYKACVNRRDGLQDTCDPMARDALKKCCRPNQ